MLTETKRKISFVIFMLFFLNFSIINIAFNYCLTVRTPECFLTLPFHSTVYNIVLPRRLSKHSLALNQLLTKDKDGSMELTNIESSN
jgi:hypothetical protein